MRKAVIAAGVALAWLAGPGHTQTASATPGPHARELAQALVAADGERARLSKLTSMELVLPRLIEQTLDVADPVKKDRIGVVVHNRIQALEDDLIEVRVSAMAQTFTVEELDGALAFDRSPTGQAYLRAAPELNRELTSVVFASSAPEADGPPPSDQKLALINRILKAREVETNTRRGRRVLNALMANALPGAAKTTASIAATANDPAQEDAYVKRVLAVEAQFYATTFSDEQLTELGAYFDGPTGRAFTEHAAQLASAAAGPASKSFAQQFERMDAEACEAAGCSGAQRAALDAQFSKMRSAMAMVMNANAMAH